MSYWYWLKLEDPVLKKRKYHQRDVTPTILEQAEYLFYAFREHFGEEDADTWEDFQARGALWVSDEPDFYSQLVLDVQLELEDPNWELWESWDDPIEVMAAALFNFWISDPLRRAGRHSWLYLKEWLRSPDVPDETKENIRRELEWWQEIVRKAQMGEREEITIFEERVGAIAF